MYQYSAFFMAMYLLLMIYEFIIEKTKGARYGRRNQNYQNVYKQKKLIIEKFD